MSPEPSIRLSGVMSRRDLLKATAAGGAALGSSSVLAACFGEDAEKSRVASSGPRKRGGHLRVGVSGGGSGDTLDPNNPISKIDDARAQQLYSGLAAFDRDYRVELVLAEEITRNADASTWDIRLKPDLLFSNGKPITADDVIFSINRITDPEAPGVGELGLKPIKRMKKLDNRTVRVFLDAPYVLLDQEFAQFYNVILPEGFDPKKPVGAGPFKFESFVPGDRSVFVRNENYFREGEPYLDQVTIIDFSDPTPQVNALLGGAVDAIDGLPPAQVASVEGQSGFKLLNSQTGGWLPFTMNCESGPFRDPRVRQALKLCIDREQMVEQALLGFGSVANDIFARFDPSYNSDLPQRNQDLDQAKSLLRQAGQSDLRVTLNTAPVAVGLVEAAQVLAEQAKGAGVTIDVRRESSSVLYGDNYLKWPFYQDYWYTRNWIPQAAQGMLPTSPFNGGHWDNERYFALYEQARREVDDAKRAELIHEAQRLEYEEGPNIIWTFNNQVDAHSARVVGLETNKSGLPLDKFGFRHASFA